MTGERKLKCGQTTLSRQDAALPPIFGTENVEGNTTWCSRTMPHYRSSEFTASPNRITQPRIDRQTRC